MGLLGVGVGVGGVLPSCSWSVISAVCAAWASQLMTCYFFCYGANMPFQSDGATWGPYMVALSLYVSLSYAEHSSAILHTGWEYSIGQDLLLGGELLS